MKYHEVRVAGRVGSCLSGIVIHIKICRYINIKFKIMKTRNNYLSRAWIMGLGILLLSTQCTESAGLEEQEFPNTGKEVLLSQGDDLTDAEIEGIRFMREEEKLARDVYLYLYELYPLRPFENIASSEQAHMDAIAWLIQSYQIEDPVGDNPEGVFQNGDLQELYRELIEQGSASEVEALKVGALIEEVDIIDLRKELESVAQNEEVTGVYTSLCRASENHLRAFTRVLVRYGVEYTPVKLSQEEFDRIMMD
jgi:hypothetical protein